MTKTHKSITKNKKKYLEKWTKLKCKEILFDSKCDDQDYQTSVLNKRIIGRKQLLFLIEDETKEKFGYYLNTEIQQDYQHIQRTDEKSFHFNLNKSMKYPIKILKYGNKFQLFDNNNSMLIQLGDINLKKKSDKKESFYKHRDCVSFDYKGLTVPFSFPIHYLTFEKMCFNPKRIVVLQMN